MDTVCCCANAEFYAAAYGTDVPTTATESRDGDTTADAAGTCNVSEKTADIRK